MAYDHKKSLRTLTDEQFSDGTTVDGSRIDDALEEAVEHFNSIPEGDVSTRFTKTQYVFGYQPAGFTGTPVAGAATTFQATSGTIEGPLFPWNYITNNENTTAVTDPGPPISYGDASTPVAGFQNKWRIKGTNYHTNAAAFALPISNEGATGSSFWEIDWTSTAAGTTTAIRRNPANAYQLAWSHSWVFDDPVILDSVCALLRTDVPSDLAVPPGNTFGYYDAPFQFSDPANIINQSNNVSLHISVDNEFSKEERDLNDVEFIFQDRWLDGYEVNPFMSSNAAANFFYGDMLPNSPDYDTGASAGKGIHGRLIRFRDLNIPIRQGARVRFSIVVPWIGMQAGLAWPLSRYSQGLRTGNLQYKFNGWAPGGDKPEGTEPVYGFSMNGCMTVLEAVGK